MKSEPNLMWSRFIAPFPGMSSHKPESGIDLYDLACLVFDDCVYSRCWRRDGVFPTGGVKYTMA